MRFPIDPARLRGDQLADEIQRATGLDVRERYTLVLPDQLEINGADVEAQADAIRAVYAAHQPQAAYFPEERQQAGVRTRVRSLAGSAVGVQVQDLTAAQVRALMTCLLYGKGAIDDQGKIKPLGEWVT